MINKVWYINSSGDEPYANQALEEYLLRNTGDGELILYLWQNRPTVVLGRNQNYLRECAAEDFLRSGGLIARRLSGGGAVYHDAGCLNFSFCVNEADYDPSRQLAVVLEALRALGIRARISGRNDILAGNRKFSGSAYYRLGGHCLHHGTLMVDVDKEALARVLTPSAAKLGGKGVASVNSRVVDLVEIEPSVTVEKLRSALISSLARIYGVEAAEYPLDEDAGALIDEYRDDFADSDWLFASSACRDAILEKGFSWGEINIGLALEQDIIADAEVYSDAMDCGFIMELAVSLIGVKYEKEAMIAAARQAGAFSDTAAEIVDDICNLLKEAV